MRADHEHVDRISTQTTFVVLGVTGILAYVLQWALLPFAVAGLLGYIFSAPIDWTAGCTRIPRAAVASLVYLALLAVVWSIIFLAFPPLLHELAQVAVDFQGTIETITRAAVGARTLELFGRTVDAPQVTEAAVTGLRNWLQQSEHLTSLGTFAFFLIFDASLAAVLLFYFLVGGRGIAAGLFWLVPPKQRPLVRHIWMRLDPILKRYFVGVVCVVIYAAVAAYAGLGLVLGIRHAVFLALLTGILEMIPVIGPASAAIIAGLIAIHQATSIGPIIAYAIYATALRLSIDQLVGPLALGVAARLHPALIMFCFLSGGVLFGIVGIILAVPVALTIKVTLSTLYDEPEAADEKDR